MRDSLNERILPGDYYALAEQRAGAALPDALTLQHEDDNTDESSSSEAGGLMVADAPPRVWQYRQRCLQKVFP